MPCPARPVCRSRITGLLLLLALAPHIAPAATDWRTPAEQSDYTRTPRYAETFAYFERLAAASPQVRIFEFGTSPQGRALKAVVAPPAPK